MKNETKFLPLDRLSILVLEDEALIAHGVKHTLIAAGSGLVFVAHSLAEANELIAAQQFDAAVLDIWLPEGSSFSIAHTLLGMGKGVVFHSGHAVNRDVTAEFPDARFCEKPSLPADLVYHVAASVGRSDTAD